MKRLLSLLRATSLLATCLYGFAGGGFIVAMLIMARVLGEQEFARAALIIALCNIGVSTAPAGLNGIVLRHDLRTDTRLLLVGSIVACVTAVLIALLGASAYEFDATSISAVFAAVLIGGVTQLIKSSLQRAHEFSKMVMVSQSANAGLILAAVLMLLGIGRKQWIPTAVVAVIFATVGWCAWRWALVHQRQGQSIRRSMWRDAANFTGVALTLEVMIQLEKLLIPLVLGVADLAIFTVVAAVALAPFRMLEMGTMTTLTARLRGAATIPERWSLLRREFVMLLMVACIGSIGIMWLGPRICTLAYPGQEEVPLTLMFAAVISGIIRIFAAVTRAMASAFCTGEELQLVNAGGWLAVSIGAVAGYAFAEFGLVGLMYGVAIGWLVRTGLSAIVAHKHLRA